MLADPKEREENKLLQVYCTLYNNIVQCIGKVEEQSLQR